MPPTAVKAIRDLIYWEYAKLISGRAVGDRRNYRFVMYTFKRLQAGKLHPSTILRENRLVVETCADCCAYCGGKEALQWKHIIPLCKGGPDTIDNQVLACQTCNTAKAGRDPFEWYGLERRPDQTDLNRDGRLDIFDLGVVLKPVAL